jgi:hypothetical protein
MRPRLSDLVFLDRDDYGRRFLETGLAHHQPMLRRWIRYLNGVDNAAASVITGKQLITLVIRLILITAA